MNNYLATLTVKALREIAKQIGLRFISRYRKAELITLIVAEIDACHIEAAREDKIRTRQNAPKVSLMDYPAVDGRVVTQVHGDICKTRGCVTYVKNGMDMGFCPRCGNITTSEEQITDTDMSHTEALELDALINEAYAHQAEDVNMTVGQYLAHRGTHAKAKEIFLSGFWKTPIADMHKVVVMDNGARFGVSNSDASFFTGEVYDMPDGEIAKCVHCRETVLMPAIESNDSEEKEMDAIKSVIKVANDAITALMPSLIASRTVFESVRDSGVASEEMIGYAYQAYTDTYRAIKEYERTIAYAEDI